jgi:hypothetical protein
VGPEPTATRHRTADLPYHVVAYDYGVKLNILRMLVAWLPPDRGAGADAGQQCWR